MSAPTPTSARDRSFRRKVAYLIAMGGLLVLLSLLSHPATPDTKEAKGRPGGKLAGLRDKYGLNQAELGQIDPSGETIKLATLGLRGIAVDILWYKANQYQMKKDWTNLRATLEQISKLQPHSIGVWRYQAWNLSYNVAVSFDDYHDKYYWIIEGIKFLQKGVEANEREPRLLGDVGWFISHKIGRADEAKQYRKLFKEDDQFNGSLAPDARDNWLVGKGWFREAEALAKLDDERHPLGASKPIFFANAPLCQFYYAEALEKDGRFGEVAPRAWKQAGVDWHDFGEVEFPSASGNGAVRLNDKEKHQDAANKLIAALDKLAPGLRKQLVDDKVAKLTPKEQKARATPADKRTDEQNALVFKTDLQVDVTHEEVANRVTGVHRQEARKLAKAATHEEEIARGIGSERSPVNFEYWKVRAEMEQTPEAVAARHAIYDANQAYARANNVVAREAYERGLKGWRNLLDRFPQIKNDINTGQDLVGIIGNYRECLEQLDAPFPKPFILQDILDQYATKK